MGRETMVAPSVQAASAKATNAEPRMENAPSSKRAGVQRNRERKTLTKSCVFRGVRSAERRSASACLVSETSPGVCLQVTFRISWPTTDRSFSSKSIRYLIA